MSKRQQTSFRSSLAHVRGLGSGRKGSGHFVGQRSGAIALAVLVPLSLWLLVAPAKGGFATARASLAEPVNAVLIILTMSIGCYHMWLGLQTVIEDYVSHPPMRYGLLWGNGFFALLVFTMALVSVLRIAN